MKSTAQVIVESRELGKMFCRYWMVTRNMAGDVKSTAQVVVESRELGKMV